MSITYLRLAPSSTAIVTEGGLDLVTTATARSTSTLPSLAEEKTSSEKTSTDSLIDHPHQEIPHLREISEVIRAIERLIEPDVAFLPFH